MEIRAGAALELRWSGIMAMLWLCYGSIMAMLWLLLAALRQAGERGNKHVCSSYGS